MADKNETPVAAAAADESDSSESSAEEAEGEAAEEIDETSDDSDDSDSGDEERPDTSPPLPRPSASAGGPTRRPWNVSSYVSRVPSPALWKGGSK